MSLVVVNQSGEGDQTNLEEYSWTRHIKSHAASRHTTIKQTSEIVGNLNGASDLFNVFNVVFQEWENHDLLDNLQSLLVLQDTYYSLSDL